MHGAGILALGVLMDRTVEGREGRSYSRITKIAPYCCWTGGIATGRKWNDIQNITKDIREFRGFLVQLYYSVEHV